jgi:hypothetical protein
MNCNSYRVVAVSHPRWSNRRLVAQGTLGVLLVLASLLAGCASAELNFQRALTVAVHTVGAAHSALVQYDEEKTSAIAAKIHAGDVEAARSEYLDYAAKRDMARKVLDTALAALDVTNSGNKLYHFVIARDWDHALQEVGAVVLRVRAVLREFGVEVP